MTLTGCSHAWLIHLLFLAGGGCSKHGSSCTKRVITVGARCVGQEEATTLPGLGEQLAGMFEQTRRLLASVIDVG